MNRILKICCLLSICCFFVNDAQAQLFIDDGVGGAVYIRDASAGTLGGVDATINVALYVDGDVTVEGVYDNQAAETQIKGNVTNSGTLVTTGDEVLNGTGTQTLAGTFTGTNDFHNLLVNKTASTLVDLTAMVETDASGELKFLSGGIIRTNANHIYVKNTAMGSIVGHGTSGSTDKYIQGTVRRAIVAGNNYNLPTGDAIHANQTAQINFTNLSGASYVEASYDNSSYGAVAASQTACDAGGDSANDELQYTEQLGTWTVTADGTNGAYDYSITLVSGGTNVFTGSPTHDAMLKDGSYEHCSNMTGNYTKSGLTGFSTFTMQGGTVINILPVDLVSLEARPIDNKYINIHWEVASEDNVKGYEVQRSTSGDEYQRIGFVDALNVSDYDFDDMDIVPGIAYFYRLKMIDLDETFEYSNIVSAKLSGKSFEIIKFPNPMKSENAFITLNAQTPQGVNLVVSNILGQVLFSKNCQLTASDYELRLPCENWASGTYFISIGNSVEKIAKKFVIHH